MQKFTASFFFFCCIFFSGTSIASEIIPIPCLKYKDWVNQKVYFNGEPIGYVNIDARDIGSTGIIIESNYEDQYAILKIKGDNSGVVYTHKRFTSNDPSENKEYLNTNWYFAFLRDINDAKKQLVGRTFWNRTIGYTLNIDEKLVSDNQLKTVIYKKYSPVKVVDITYPLLKHNSNIRLIYKTENGDLAFTDLIWSGTDTEASSTSCQPFSENRLEDNFLLEDPRLKYPWNETVWKFIEKQLINIGMTKEQVIMSKGEPDKINKTVTKNKIYEQWVYRNTYVYFEDNIVQSYQD